MPLKDRPMSKDKRRKRIFSDEQREIRSLRATEWNRKHRALHVARTLAARARRK